METAPLPGDSRFFARTGPHTLAAVADAAGLRAPPRMLSFTGVAPLQTAGPEEVGFLENRKLVAALRDTRAGCVFVPEELLGEVPGTAIGIAAEQPQAAWARVAALFHPVPPAVPGIHPTALIGEGASVDPAAEIGAYAVIGAAAKIGPRSRIGTHTTIGEGVVIGRDCRIGVHVSVSHAVIGNRVALYPGARIGQDGFGFVPTETGFLSVPQIGRVLIGDDVEIGANSTVDRGAMQDTVIGAGTRIDNLVMIAHNVVLGRACVIVAQVGISGSTVVGDQVMIAGQAGLIGHLKIGRGARIGAQAGVMADVPAGAEVIGAPAQPARAFFRQVALLRKLARGRGPDNAGGGTSGA